MVALIHLPHRHLNEEGQLLEPQQPVKCSAPVEVNHDLALL